jgi:hypothetical protein
MMMMMMTTTTTVMMMMMMTTMMTVISHNRDLLVQFRCGLLFFWSNVSGNMELQTLEWLSCCMFCLDITTFLLRGQNFC